MLVGRAPKERQINTFKKPFDIDHTPYKLLDFHNLVKEFCKNVKIERRLKIAKAIFIGDVGVGKTSLINRFREKSYFKSSQSTIGVDCYLEGFDVLGKPFNIQIWDTAGQERFRSVASSYFHGTTVVGLVFDVTRVNTLYNTEQWLDVALSSSNLNQPPCILLIGNKLDDISPLDLEDIKPEAFQLARKLGAEYWVVSSKTGENIDDLFQRVAVLAFEWMVMKEINSNFCVQDTIKLKPEVEEAREKKAWLYKRNE